MYIDISAPIQYCMSGGRQQCIAVVRRTCIVIGTDMSIEPPPWRTFVVHVCRLEGILGQLFSPGLDRKLLTLGTQIGSGAFGIVLQCTVTVATYGAEARSARGAAVGAPEARTTRA